MSDDVVEVTPAPPRRPRGRLLNAGVATALLAAVVVVVVWAAFHDARPGSPDLARSGTPVPCPATTPNPRASPFDQPARVPALPTASGLDGRLVPDRPPTAVALCEYPARGDVAVSSSDGPVPAVARNPLALGRHVALTATDPATTQLTTMLQSATRDRSYACPSLVAPMPQYLVGLTYADGVVWVSTPAVCADSTNGDTTAFADAAPVITGALDADPATSVPPVAGSGAPGDPGSSTPGGGADPDPSPSATPPADPFAACVAPPPTKPTPVDRLVPFTPTAVRICHAPVGPDAPRATTVDRPATSAVSLADAVNASPPRASDTACPDIGGETWRLLFTGADGRQASVFVDAGGCRTVSVYGRSLQAGDALFALLDAND